MPACARFALSLSLVGMASIGFAADDCFVDGRFDVTTIPGVSSLEYNVNGKSGDEDAKARGGLGLGLGVEVGGFAENRWGWVGGATLFESASRASGENGHDDLKTGQVGIELNAGLAYRVTRRFHLELTPFIGVGRDRLTDVGGDHGSDATGKGNYLDYGLRLGGFYTLNDRWQIGLDVGYLGSRAKGDITYSSAPTVDATMKTGGLNLGLVIGFRF